MSKSALPRFEDARAIWELAGECRELGDDRTAWREHWVAGLCRLAGADWGLAGEMAGCLDLKMRDLGVTFWWRPGALDFAALIAHLARFRSEPRYSPAMIEYYRRYRVEPGRCLTREDFIDDPDWYRSSDYARIQGPFGADATLWCSNPVGTPAAGESSNVILLRAAGRRDFSRRDRAIVREAQAAIAPHVGRALARYADPSPSQLPPRVRETLACLLEGDGDKQIAHRLGLATTTVNEYVKVVFRHFGVQSRPELLARWIRRGWGPRPAPAVPTGSAVPAGDGYVATFDAGHHFETGRTRRPK